MKKLFSKEFIIGICVIISVAILIFGIEYLKGINMLSPANFYYVSCDNVSGLTVSAPVQIDGFKVGQVREIEYDYDRPGKIKVLLAVNKKLRVPTDSYADMSSTLMGGAFINLHVGTSKDFLAVGSDIPVHPAKDLMSSISDDVMPAVNSILPKVDSLLYNLNLVVTDPALTASIHRLDAITANLESTARNLNAATGKDVPAVLGNTRRLTWKLDSVSSNLMALSAELNRLPLAQTIDNVNDISGNLAVFSKQLNNPNSTLGLLTTDPELYNRLNRVSADIDSLIVDIKKNPKRYISIKLL